MLWSSKGALAKLAPPEAVLFDIDGTLCDSDSLHPRAFQVMLQEVDCFQWRGSNEEYFFENIAGKHNDDIARLLFPNDFPRGLKFCEDKEAMLRKLHSEQLKPLKRAKDHTFILEDSVSGIKAGVAAGLLVLGLTTRNPEHSVLEAKPTFLIKDYDDPKLWEALEELDT
ncbi:haloacid dehalogenase-like hydrolase domain-containing protein Sgpp [Melia azedarach]|uniref:Haloacid dehalogenase-like hydrolase domain-containing protein Sgpp n=1 Tax=Melia azedarach TaxID=155640 RepID=A0ACC1YMG1_MELAZ|nr:haloacid dehalogenase-like hydrolase domain-containing protein Sgpp [Melia azedarach]